MSDDTEQKSGMTDEQFERAGAVAEKYEAERQRRGGGQPDDEINELEVALMSDQDFEAWTKKEQRKTDQDRAKK